MLVPAGARITAKAGGGEPPVFETDAPLDVLPAQIAALITTRGGLTDINGRRRDRADRGRRRSRRLRRRSASRSPGTARRPSSRTCRPSRCRCSPSPTEATHTDALSSASPSTSRSAAGFKGARASLHLQIDDDEEPEPRRLGRAPATRPLSVVNAFGSGPPLVEYDYYRPPPIGAAAGHLGDRCRCSATTPTAGAARAPSASTCR